MDFKSTNPASQYLELLAELGKDYTKDKKSQVEHIHSVQVARSGTATMARLAASLAERGKTVVLMGRDANEVSELKALSLLFSPDYSVGNQPLERPLWEESVFALPEYPVNLQVRNAWATRLAALYALRERKKAGIVVCSISNLLYRLIPTSFFQDRQLVLRKGDDFAPELIVEQAIEWGYHRTPLVNRPGEVALRGDILDIYGPGYLKPLRLEFFGDKLEDIRLFEASNQRSLAKLNEITILPSSVASGKDAEAVALRRWQGLLAEKRLEEDDIYPLKKAFAAGASNLFAGMLNPEHSLLENWLPKDSVYILPSESQLKQGLDTAAQALESALEKQIKADGIHQPKNIVMRSPAEAYEGITDKSRVCFEDLVMGVERRGLDLNEHKIHSFAELFPGPSDDRPWQKLVGSLKQWNKEKRRVLLSFSSERSRAKFLKLAEQDGIHPHMRWDVNDRGVFALVSPFNQGAELLWDANLLILGENVIQPKSDRPARTASSAFRGMDSYSGLEEGALLVHRDYGIGRFGGLHRLDMAGVANDYLLLNYAGQDRLYLPVDRLSLVQSYKGGDDGVSVDKLGGNGWVNSKDKAKKAIELIAQDLVDMYAYRKIAKGFRYGPMPEIFREFEASFGFEETPDQIRAINDVLNDMDKGVPMDRLVCGDVGFGKTEVALRAAFRAACDGRQVALLCPTTVLAEQHYQTFRARLAAFPINVAVLSRFVSKQKQKETLEQAAKGHIDILIGTHRLLSKDVVLPKLGLLIMDEEQRFGVRHKESLKQLKRNVDALTLTATPIPRTLQLSMSGIRELSVIETAPPERKPVATALIKRDEKTLRHILEREIERKGQVFWVHNRVQGLERVAEFVKKLVPTARVGMAHGQMAEKALEDTMHKFWHSELDVLVCTAIVESGLDFPMANTLIVDQAQMFGLGQLYQLRGRVGRSDRQAYAIFVVPDPDSMPDMARERLRIILELDYLGAGFQVAMEDLRLRGAGNILGESQSGHMTRLGIDLFLELLEEAVAKLRGQPLREERETELNLSVPAHIPEDYMVDAHERLKYYKNLSSAHSEEAMNEIGFEIRDRFGNLPQELENFMAILNFKRFLQTHGVSKADIYMDKVRLSWDMADKEPGKHSYLAPDKIMPWINQRAKRARLLPPATLELAFENATLGESLKPRAPYLLPTKSNAMNAPNNKQDLEHAPKTPQTAVHCGPDLKALLATMSKELESLLKA